MLELKKIKMFACLIIAIFILQAGVTSFAMTAKQVGKDTIEITGQLKNADTPKYISIELIAHGQSVIGISNPLDVIKYHDQIRTSRDGSYKFLIKMGENTPSGIYDIKLASENGAEIDTNGDETIVYSSYKSAEQAFKNLYDTALTSEEVFKSYVKEHRYDFNFVHDLTYKVNEDTALGMLYQYIQKKRVNSIDELTAAYEKALMTEGILENKVSDIYTYIDESHIVNTELKLLYNAAFLTDNAKKYISERLITLKPQNCSEFDTDIVSAWILGVIKNPNGYSNIETVLKKFSNIIGIDISGISDMTSVCRGLAGQDVSSMQELRSKIESLNSKHGNSSSGGGSSGGGGDTRPSSSKPKGEDIVSLHIPVNNNTGMNPTTDDTIPILIYSDINNVEWAQKAIVSLTERGILSGRGNGVFAPDDAVTREEFVKMISEAFLKNEKEADVDFIDVSVGAWYMPSLKKAYAANLVNGLSDTYFGIGNSIKRQEMAAIAYRTAVLQTEITEIAEEEYQLFGDDAQIEGYARKAIYTLREMGVINGISEDLYAPLSEVSRAQAAVIIYNLLEL